MVDELPEDVRARAQAVFDLRVPAAAVADLEFDSLVDDPAGVAAPVRELRFRGDGREVSVQVAVAGDGVSLTVRLLPPESVGLTVHHEDQPPVSVQTDAEGCVTLPRVPSGLVTVVVQATEPGQVPPLRTAWTRV